MSDESLLREQISSLQQQNQDLVEQVLILREEKEELENERFENMKRIARFIDLVKNLKLPEETYRRSQEIVSDLLAIFDGEDLHAWF